jgi:hypothetical protein
VNRKKKKNIYINIKNSWKKHLLSIWRDHPSSTKIIDITTSPNLILRPNPKHPSNKIIMDFRNRDEIVKYGVKFCKGCP